MSDKTVMLHSFMGTVVDGWMLGDLKTLTSIPHNPGGSGNCNFPIALYVFACIEFLGQLTYEGTLPDMGYTQASVMGFIDSYFPDDFKRQLKLHRGNFVNMFRNGLAHNYFAKAAGISRTNTEPFSIENECLVLDADRFAEAFVLSIGKLKDNLKNDQQLVERIIDRYDKLYKANLKFKLSPTLLQTYQTRTSGASLAHPDMLKRVETYTSTSPKVNPSKTTTTLPPWLISNDSD